MENFNEYRDRVDFTPFIDYILENGKLTHLKRKEYFGMQDTIAQYIGYIKDGAIRYTRYDEEGKEHVVGYCFEEDFACDYISLIHQAPRLVNIQAVKNTTLYVITYSQMMQFVELTPGGDTLYTRIVEEYSTTMYKRLLSFYCETPEYRYLDLLKRCPGLCKMIPLKEIASFIGVTPETLSHIRTRLKKEGKDPDLLL